MTNANLCMKSKCFSVLVAAFFLQGAVFADTVAIDPGDGVATNVTQRITGATDVAVNCGSKRSTQGVTIAVFAPRLSMATFM